MRRINALRDNPEYAAFFVKILYDVELIGSDVEQPIDIANVPFDHIYSRVANQVQNLYIYLDWANIRQNFNNNRNLPAHLNINNMNVAQIRQNINNFDQGTQTIITIIDELMFEFTIMIKLLLSQYKFKLYIRNMKF